MDLKIGVTPPNYDDIGAVLNKMEYKYYPIELSQLSNSKVLSTFNVIFINCTQMEDIASKTSHAIRDYVSKGGVVYASDWASVIVEAGFGEYVKFNHGERSGKVESQVIDTGLAIQVGEYLNLTFDLDEWHSVKTTSGDVIKHLVSKNKPLLISFRHGKGQVIFTSFHNHAQVNEKEAQLLRYLVLKPLMADVMLEMTDLPGWADSKELQENLGTVHIGMTSEWYTYNVVVPRPLKVMLNWKGEADLQLDVDGPGFLQHQESNHPPISISVPLAVKGVWRYRVHAKSAALKNFPYALIAGSPARVEAAVEPGVPSELTRRLAAMTPLPNIDPNILSQIKLENETEKTNGNLDIRLLDE